VLQHLLFLLVLQFEGPQYATGGQHGSAGVSRGQQGSAGVSRGQQGSVGVSRGQHAPASTSKYQQEIQMTAVLERATKYKGRVITWRVRQGWPRRTLTRPDPIVSSHSCACIMVSAFRRD
jgi:hypothetical protein